MGFVEKYGLVALFALCALIVGVGVFAGDGALSKTKDGDRSEKRVAERGRSLVENAMRDGESPEGDSSETPADNYQQARIEAEKRRKSLAGTGNSGLQGEPNPPVLLDGAFQPPDGTAGDAGSETPWSSGSSSGNPGLSDDAPGIGRMAAGEDEPSSTKMRIGGTSRGSTSRGSTRTVPPAKKGGRAASDAERGEDVPRPSDSELVSYPFQRGDSLWRIAKRFYGVKRIDTQMAAIRAANPQTNFDKLRYPGTVMLPRKGMLEGRIALAKGGAKPSGKARRHVVAKGETLWSISEKYYGNGAKYKRLARFNGLAVQATLQPGTKLRIPGALED